MAPLGMWLHIALLFVTFAASIHTTSSLEVPPRQQQLGHAHFPFSKAVDKVGVEPDEVHAHSTRLAFMIVFMSGIIVGVALTISLQATVKGSETSISQPQEPATTEFSVATQDDIEMRSMENYDIEHFWPRCSCLCLLLVVQSGSSILLELFRPLLENYTSLVYYFTMLVGLGGNAGVQSVVISVRRFAVKESVSIWEQAEVGFRLSLVLAPLAFIRCFIQATDLSICVVVGIAAGGITLLATGFGTSLTVALFKAGFDPAHASPAVQVLMDIIGLTIVCLVASVWVQAGWMSPPDEVAL